MGCEEQVLPNSWSLPIMSEFGQAAIVLAILVASAAVGLFIRSLLPEKHRSRETVEIVQLIITMLVTFASLVMGLLTYTSSL
jgi:hypothetical protein